MLAARRNHLGAFRINTQAWAPLQEVLINWGLCFLSLLLLPGKKSGAVCGQLQLVSVSLRGSERGWGMGEDTDRPRKAGFSI